jgi:hypothetical protein
MNESPGVTSRTTIGLTESGKDALAQVMAAKWFSEDRFAFKFAVAHALANSLPPTDDSGGPFGTIWNRGTLDPDDRLVELVSIYSDESDIWDFIRRLGDAGLKDLAAKRSHIGMPSEVLEISGE